MLTCFHLGVRVRIRSRAEGALAGTSRRANSQGVIGRLAGPTLWDWPVPREPALHRSFRLSGYFESRERCKVQEDERDLLEVLIFDEIEETVRTYCSHLAEYANIEIDLRLRKSLAF
jgi:hypothetical protein